MTIFDIMGPVMVGPSSSHTAGAVRIGLITRRLLGSQPVSADLLLHGSFAATGAGHGTDKALVSGLLGLRPDDPDIPRAFALAAQAGMKLTVGSVVLRGAHPNTVVLRVTNAAGRTLEVNASSLGGGRVRVNSLDGLEASFTGDYPTLIIRNEDRPGYVAEVANLLSEHGVNIATMQLYRDRRGGLAVMVIESDQSIPEGMVDWLRGCPGIVRAVYLDMKEHD
ncbi:MAG: L-serine ammonia-lyase, iron-sulfur-dependent subunit beta [Oscillospiraceae bacterium]